MSSYKRAKRVQVNYKSRFLAVDLKLVDKAEFYRNLDFCKISAYESSLTIGHQKDTFVERESDWKIHNLHIVGLYTI